jgi:hypothetical protein
MVRPIEWQLIDEYRKEKAKLIAQKRGNCEENCTFKVTRIRNISYDQGTVMSLLCLLKLFWGWWHPS